MGEGTSRFRSGVNDAKRAMARRAILPALVPALCGLILVVIGLLGMTVDGARLLILGGALIVVAVGVILVGLGPRSPEASAYVVNDEAPGSMSHYGWDAIPVSRDIRLRLVGSAQCQEGLAAARTAIEHGRSVAAFAPSLGGSGVGSDGGMFLFVNVDGRTLRIGRVPSDFEHPVVAAFGRRAAADRPAEIPVDVREQAGGLRAELRIGEVGPDGN